MTGTIIRGTHRLQDLLPTFCEENKARGGGDYLGEIPPNALEDDTHPYWESVDATNLFSALFDNLNDLAPDGYFFGFHSGDRSDFGFWPIENT